MKNYVIIGNGVAGSTAAESIRQQDPDGSITMVTDEDLPFYNRMKLNELIAGELSEADLVMKKEAWYQDQGIELKLKTRITGAEPEDKVIFTQENFKIPYDSLLLATGSHSFIPPINGVEKVGVFTLRNMDDARNIKSFAKEIDEVILIGGGLLGLEAGKAISSLNKKVIVVEFFPRLLPRQLDVDGAKRLQEIMEQMGFSFRLGAKTQEILGDPGVEGVLLDGGERLDGKMVIISAGVRPNMELAQVLGLETDKGIIVDDHLRTKRSGVFAAGDVAEFRGMPYGIWTAAMEQGKIAGVNMAGGDMVYEGTTMANTLKVVGVDLASAGDIDAENELESHVVKDGSVYKKIVIKENRIVGCIMLGETGGFNKITKAMKENRDISEIKDRLISEDFDLNTL
jgi:nitrite reductase (NADH) large subunit